MNYKVYWNKTAEKSLSDILDYIIENNGKNNAQKVYTQIMKKAELLKVDPEQGRIVPELKSLGNKYREIIHKPWRIMYSTDNEIVKVLLVIDGRRNIDDVLFDYIIQTGGS